MTNRRERFMRYLPGTERLLRRKKWRNVELPVIEEWPQGTLRTPDGRPVIAVALYASAPEDGRPTLDVSLSPQVGAGPTLPVSFYSTGQRQTPDGRPIYAVSSGLGSAYLDANSVYVSSVAYNGIPVGNDATGTGTRANPYLTIDAAYTAAAAGKVILLNGDPSAPTDYRHATYLTVAKAVTIDSVLPYGAIISSTTTTARVIHASVLGMLHIGKVIIDGRDLTPCLITVPLGASATTLRLRGTKFIRFTDSITAPTVGANLALDAEGCISVSNNAVCGGFFGNTLGLLSSVRVVGCVITALNQVSERGLINFRADGVGVPFVATGNTLTVTISLSATGSQTHFGVKALNMNATVAGNIISISGDVTGQSANGILVAPDNVGTPYTVTGSLVENNTVAIDGAGGICICAGNDGQGTAADAITSTGVVVRGNRCRGSVIGQVKGLHSILVGTPGMAGTKVHRNWIESCDLALVDKCATNTEWTGNVIVDCASNPFRIKGSQGGIFRHNTIIQKTPAFGQAMVYQTNNDIPVITNSTGVKVESNNIFASGFSATGRMVQQMASQSATFANNNFFGYGGGTNPFRSPTTNYSTLGAWNAGTGSTGTNLDPMFVDAASGNYDLQTGSPLAGKVTRTVLADFNGAAFADPATVGAFEASV